MPPVPKALLMDVGGVFFLPSHDRILGAFARAEFTPVIDSLDRAHYAGAAALSAAAIEGLEWPLYWNAYLDAYLDACAAPDDLRADLHTHLDSEFSVGPLWTRIAPGAHEGLAALAAAGVRLGIVSNADGTVEQQLRAAELVQVGPGRGVPVECVIDSSVVGVSKPDARIFDVALTAMSLEPEHVWYLGDTPGIDVEGARNAGLWPVVLDPYQLHMGADFDRVDTLAELAEVVTTVTGG
ncbi:MAG: HAD family hydrolase [Acidimicrobiia bacterium]